MQVNHSRHRKGGHEVEKATFVTGMIGVLKERALKNGNYDPKRLAAIQAELETNYYLWLADHAHRKSAAPSPLP